MKIMLDEGAFKKSEPYTIKIKKITDSAIVPKRSSRGAAGYDLSVDSSEPIVIKPHHHMALSLPILRSRIFRENIYEKRKLLPLWS